MFDFSPERIPVAWFVTPHGLGHASRAAAIMEALQNVAPAVDLHIFTTVPEALFRDSLARSFHYRPVETDVGLVQTTSLREDVAASASRLAEFLPFDSVVVDELAQELVERHCRLAVADIAPLGIAAARRAGIPSVLVENFTWDWIYEGYEERTDQLKPFAGYLREFFEAADHHIQTVPVCRPSRNATVVPPVSRQPRQGRNETRGALQIPGDAQTLLVSMGGVPEACECEDRLFAMDGITFLIPGTGRDLERRGNIIRIPFHAGFYHPDLVYACDAVVGKVGYSTMAEVYHAGLPFAYVRRRHFREATTLSTFIADQFHGMPLEPEEFESGSWTECVPELLSLPRKDRGGTNGAELAAGVLHDLL